MITKIFQFLQKHQARIALALAVVLPILILWLPLSDPDFWWHLRLGDMMLHGQGVPRTEQFSWTMYGRPFVDFYWVSEIILAALFHILQPLGITFVFACLGTWLILWQTRITKEFGWRDFFVIVFIAAAIMPVFGTRPQLISWFFFVVMLRLVKQAGKLPHFKTAVIALILFTVWVNMHDGFVLPLLYLVLVIGIDILFTTFQWLKQDWSPKPFLSRNALQNLLIVFSVALACLLLTPYGIAYPKTIIHEAMSSQNKAYIAEWQPLYLRTEFGVLYFAITLTTLIGAAYRRLWHFHEWILHSLLFFVGAASAVHSTFAILLFAPSFLKVIHSIDIPKEMRFYARLYVLMLTILAGVLLFSFRWVEVPKTPLLEDAAFPRKAVDALITIKPKGKLYNTYSWGGYLIYRIPQYPIFIDGRMSSWYSQNRSLITDSTTIDALKPGFTETLAKYNPDWFLIDPTISLAQWLRTNPNYQVAYEDKTAVVFIKRY